ncbi:chlororespiratory reduction protein 7 [Oscillatoriales cyanobacterium LEGE 11467]|uniref:Chlororespiratory reduction protein 7 n=1 Tax=Zarconia navalis LEGE 11467 TaxID=1828826 RepID=A0A928VV26_9CYAN|nr:chlororespiratory reduction protein 7 [Zarconia navalis]MBE9040686.1 chlororespiratory reduction protein 7 [Zarconia navalis LEGE 11467]
MSDSSMYAEEYFVFLEANSPEQILSADELREKLKTVLKNHTDRLPRELQTLNSLEDQSQHLVENCCEFELSAGKLLQWYAIRLEK